MRDWDSKRMRRQVGLGDRPRTVVGHRLSQRRGQHLNFEQALFSMKVEVREYMIELLY